MQFFSLTVAFESINVHLVYSIQYLHPRQVQRVGRLTLSTKIDAS